jgi:hypothetical protein
MTYDHENCTFDRDRVCTGCGAYPNERNVMVYPTPIMCRLDHWTPRGWETVQPAVALLDPARYPARLEEASKYGRAVELDEALQPTGREWAPSTLPKRTELVPTDSSAWGLPDPNRRGQCRHCDGYHGDPFDGSCLI